MSRDYKPIALVKTCARCSKEFVARSHATQAKYCSEPCKKPKALSKRSMDRSTGTVGAYSELLASADLIRLGFDVFRAVSPSAPCDLIVVRNGKALRIEVRTAYYLNSGEIRCNKHKGEEHRYDVMALVVPDGTIKYEPALNDAFVSSLGERVQ